MDEGLLHAVLDVQDVEKHQRAKDSDQDSTQTYKIN